MRLWPRPGFIFAARPQARSGQSYPCLCLCLGFSQITYSTPLRLTILHFEQRRLIDAFTFTSTTSPTDLLVSSGCSHLFQNPGSYQRCLFFRRASFRLAFRMPCLFALRRSSLLDTNHLFLRTVLRTRALPTSLRKRLSKLSCDSPRLSFTVVICHFSPPSLRPPPRVLSGETKISVLSSQNTCEEQQRFPDRLLQMWESGSSRDGAKLTSVTTRRDIIKTL
jgi:hypothetical protein